MQTPTFCGSLFACFRSQTATESERCFFKSRLSVALLNISAVFATEIHFGREKTEHENAPINSNNRFMLELLVADLHAFSD